MWLVSSVSGAIKKIYVGIKEPSTFTTGNSGHEKLGAAGIKVFFPVEHLRAKIMDVTLTGHVGAVGKSNP